MSGSGREFWGIKCAIFLLLTFGFGNLFLHVKILSQGAELLKQTRQYMDESARKRLLENRKMLMTLQKEHTLWYSLEQQLNYSGLKRIVPGITVENWIVGNIVLLSGNFLGMLAWGHPGQACMAVAGISLSEYLIVMIAKHKNMRAVNDNLLKFLDFLGNYSITAGEITSVFKQVSRYVEEPLKSALDECCFEAQTTGDTAMALLIMAEKIEHPKFKELIRNMEIGLRYSADFSSLVRSSRRSVREYLRTGMERKSLLREALINMVLLLGLSVFIFLTVDRLIEISIWQILFHTLPGRVALGSLGLIFALFAGRVYRIYH